jgi:hypothetical protein
MMDEDAVRQTNTDIQQNTFVHEIRGKRRSSTANTTLRIEKDGQTGETSNMQRLWQRTDKSARIPLQSI